MQPLFFVLAACAFAALAWLFLRAGGERLYKKKRLLTGNETEFYFRLRRALPNHCVFPQVSMGALLNPNVSPGNRRYNSLRNTFSQKIVDYVICDGRTLAVVAIVELDDKTHNPEKDARRDRMLNDAGYVVIRWESRQKPSEPDIAARIAGLRG